MSIDAAVDEIPLQRGGSVRSGTAFVTRATAGHTWGGSSEELKNLANSAAVPHLVVFDTWTRNCDRHPPDLAQRKANYDNVFLADGEAGPRLVAMDHSHCFTCGGDLNERIADISRVKDDRLYGLFPGFVPMIQETEVAEAAERLRTLDRDWVKEVVDSIPLDWQVSDAAKSALVGLIVRRAEYVSDHALRLIARACWPDQLFDNRA